MSPRVPGWPGRPFPGVSIGGGVPAGGTALGGGGAAPPAFRGAMVVTPDPQGIDDVTVTPLGWVTTEEDTDGYVTAAVQGGFAPTRLVVPAGRGGLYAFGASVGWDAAPGAGLLQLRVQERRLGTASEIGPPQDYVFNFDQTAGTQIVTRSAGGLIRLQPTDFLQVAVFHNSGAARNLHITNRLGVFWLLQVASS